VEQVARYAFEMARERRGHVTNVTKSNAMFEPFHGSAPDIAGKGIANPIGAIWAGAMLLDHLGEKGAASLVLQAIAQVLEEGVKSPDLGGSVSTSQMGDAVASVVGKL
jgi:tartrate dehydrogenase/decarboxylase/D-malate dehydrogenase